MHILLWRSPKDGKAVVIKRPAVICPAQSMVTGTTPGLCHKSLTINLSVVLLLACIK